MPKTPPESSKISEKAGPKSKLNLTGEQRRIVRSTAPVKQIIAVAGAAKTSTEIECAERLIKGGVDPTDILFLTALNSAKNVLRADVRPDVECKTFHALGLSLLVEANLVPGVTTKTKALTKKGQLKLLRRALKVEADRWDRVNPKAAKFLRATRKDAPKLRSLLKFIQEVRACGIEGLTDSKDKGASFPEFAAHRKCLKAVARRFSRLKARAGTLDYLDMIRLGRQAIEQGVPVGYKHIFVDEFQDCIPAQAQMLVALAPRVESLTVVADPLQSILGFAGARFIDLSSLIEGVKTYPLTLAFRLHRFSAALATALGQLVRPDMAPVRGHRSGGHRPLLIKCKDRAEHDHAVLAKVQQLIASGVPPHEIAILGRVKVQVREVEALLLSAGIETNPLGRKRGPEHVQAVLTLVEEIQGCAGKAGREKLRRVMRAVAGDREMPSSTVDTNVRMLLNAGRSRSFESHYRACAKAYISAKGKKGLTKDAIADINRWAALTRRQKDVVGMRRTIAKLAAQDKVVTSHLHQAKGGAWDHVLVLHAVEGSWPFFKANTPSARIEELHALYVAATRARKGLYLFEGRYKNARSKKEFAAPCSFFQHPAVRKCLRVVSA